MRDLLDDNCPAAVALLARGSKQRACILSCCRKTDNLSDIRLHVKRAIGE